MVLYHIEIRFARVVALFLLLVLLGNPFHFVWIAQKLFHKFDWILELGIVDILQNVFLVIRNSSDVIEKKYAFHIEQREFLHLR